MKRNYTLDFIKIIFTIIIVFHHLQNKMEFKLIHSAYICVEMFFMISGFFLYKKYANNKEMNACDYTIKRIKNIYPVYFLGLLTMFVFNRCKLEVAPKFLVECFLVQGLGLTSSWGSNLLYPCWYISVMIIGGYFIFYLIKRNEKLFVKFLAPLIAVFTYTILNGSFEKWTSVYGLFLPFWRGMADMSIGVILAYFTNTLEFKKLSSFFEKNRICLSLIEIGLLIGISMLIVDSKNFEFLCLVLFPIMIIISQFDFGLYYRVFNKKIFSKINELSYPVYVLHAPCIIFFNKFIINMFSSIEWRIICVVLMYVSLYVAAYILVRLQKYMLKKD